MYVVTFYSFKGGVGRTLALLNVAWELADSGRKVLVVDFDLEAPGIRSDRWEKRAADGIGEDARTATPTHPGIVEYVTQYMEDDLRVPDVSDFVVDVTPDDCDGRLALMPAGLDDDCYGERLRGIDWGDLYEHHDGYVMFEDTRAQWEQLGYDYVLIDSRTGYSDVGGICTRHLPDAVVTLFRPEGQSLTGMKEIVDAIRDEEPNHRRVEAIELHFVMTGIPDADDDEGILEARARLFRRELEIPRGGAMEIRQYQSMDLLMQPVYTRHRPKTRLAGRYHKLASRIRAWNIEDRGGVLERLGMHRFPDREFLDRVRDSGRHDSDPTVLRALAVGYHLDRGRGSAEEADLLAKAQELEPLPPRYGLMLAQAQHRIGDRNDALGALRDLFRSSDAPLRDEREPGPPLSWTMLQALSLLADLGEDRSEYVADSPLVGRLGPVAKTRIATELDRSRAEQREAVRLLTDALGAGGPTRRHSQWKWALGFASIASGDFAQAKSIFGEAVRDDVGLGARGSLAAMFNHGMAKWADDGTPDPSDFKELVAVDQDDLRQEGPGDVANHQQCMAVAHFLGGDEEEARARLAAAESAAHERLYAISCWTYTRVARAVFVKHCAEMRRMFDGEDIKPEFMLSE